ncbi:MAG: hypothetical protein LBC87_04795, partial [Fibromonadaceae bacterium]|nr:hypothetical protein [Fibromonadaceae bacterium]
ILAVFAASAALALLACSGSSNSTDEEQIATFKTKPLTFIDERDGKTYRYVKIGTQAWMAENLNYAAPLTNEGSAIDNEVGSVCYDNKESNCDKYGRLYYWVTAVGLPADCKGQIISLDCIIPKGTQTQRQGVCPSGWHLPDSSEWGALMNYANINYDHSYYGSNLGTKLMSESIGGTDKYGFNALLGGYHVPSNNGLFTGIEDVGWWWTTDVGEVGVYTLEIWGNKVEISSTLPSVFLSSVRCVQDDPSLPVIAATGGSSVKETPSSSSISSSSAITKPTFTNTFTDERDGKKYGYVEIGEQTWMAENLNYAVYKKDGKVADAPNGKCYMNEESNCDIYGRLYNWAAAIDSLCPDGWHLPSDAEWTKLTNFVGKNAATKLKSKIGWDSSGNGTDAYGFSALPSGHGIAGVGFERLGIVTFWWTSTEDGYFNMDAVVRAMYSSSDTVKRADNYSNNLGSVRCLKNPPPPSSSSAATINLCAGFADGTKREHYGKDKPQFCDSRDGQKYVYVEIGKQTWMAENLNYDVAGDSPTEVRKCYNDDCTAYGGIYFWATAMDLPSTYNTLPYTASAKHQGICPAGWHIPSDAEWTTLENFVGDYAGIKLKAKSGWDSSNGVSGNGNDMYGFAALPGGDGLGWTPVNRVGILGNWWSSTERETDNWEQAYTRTIMYDYDGLIYDSRIKKLYAQSIRCVKDTEK